MTLAERVTSLAQAMGADVKALSIGIGVLTPSAVTVAYTAGKVTNVTVDGVVTTIAYNVDGTVHTISQPHDGLTRTETYAYSDGALTGMTATEA